MHHHLDFVELALGTGGHTELEDFRDRRPGLPIGLQLDLAQTEGTAGLARLSIRTSSSDTVPGYVSMFQMATRIARQQAA